MSLKDLSKEKNGKGIQNNVLLYSGGRGIKAVKNEL